MGVRPQPATGPAACRLPADEAEAEATCPRCGAEMIWTKASWHCLACRYKQGCCG